MWVGSGDTRHWWLCLWTRTSKKWTDKSLRCCRNVVISTVPWLTSVVQWRCSVVVVPKGLPFGYQTSGHSPRSNYDGTLSGWDDTDEAQVDISRKYKTLLQRQLLSSGGSQAKTYFGAFMTVSNNCCHKCTKILFRLGSARTRSDLIALLGQDEGKKVAVINPAVLNDNNHRTPCRPNVSTAMCTNFHVIRYSTRISAVKKRTQTSLK